MQLDHSAKNVSSNKQSAIAGFSLELFVVFGFIAVFIFVSRSGMLTAAALQWWTDLTWTVMALATGVKCFSVTSSSIGTEQRAWRLVGLACFCWFVGMLIWDYDELIIGEITPFPALSDIGFLAFAVLFMAAFVSIRQQTGSRSFTQIQISKLGILASSIIIGHLIVLLEPVKQLDASVLYVTTAIAYPVIYMATLLYAVICFWHCLEKCMPRGFLFVVIGFAIHAIVDTFYAYTLLGKSYQIGNYMDIVWLLGFAFIYWGAVENRSANKHSFENKILSVVTSRYFNFEALVPVLAVFTVLLVSYLYRYQLSADTLYALFPAAFVLIVFIAIGEIANQTYQEEIRSKLAKSQEHLGSVLATIPYGVQEIDTAGNILFSNEAHDILFGYDRGELLGKNISMFFADPEEGKETITYLQYLVDQHPKPKPKPIFAADRKKDGSNILVQVDWNYKFDTNGKVTGFISILTDITEKRQADLQLRQAAAVFESTSEAIMITDVEGNITAVNNSFNNITGYSEAEVLGKNPRILRSERHDDHFFNQMWKAIRTVGYWRGEVWDRRKNGEVFPVWQSVSAINNGSGLVNSYVSVFTDISTLKQTQEQLNYLAYHDPLTDLPNRLLFNDRLNHALERAARLHNQLAVLFIDMDNFKNVNDSLGHPIGDELLVKVADRLRQLSRKDDTVARLGGDEFVIIMENIDETKNTVVLAQKLIEAFNEPIIIQDHELHITISIGISIYPHDGNNAQTLIRNADVALYRAKDEGRNDFYYYTKELTASVVERLKIESALRNALKNNELLLYYQPQISLDTGKIIGLEALLRWQNPDLGLLLPDRFISLAEDTGLIISIGEWVLSSACQQLKAWQQQGYDFGRVAVNVSGLQFQRGDFQKSVNDVLSQSQLEPQYLELEITENFIMHKTERAINTLEGLKALGIQIAIDDFGTGYSSLSYLKRLPVDKLKIDSSFVRDIPQDANDKAIACAVIALAKTLQLHVIAEGVETVEQRDFLLEQGCNEAQGYFYSRPIPVAKLLAFADSHSLASKPEAT